MIEIDYHYPRTTFTLADPVYMYSTGIKLKVNNPPDGNYHAEFDQGEKVYPVDDVIAIPDSYFEQCGPVNVYLVVVDGPSVNTLTKIVIPVAYRPPRKQS